MPLVQQWISRFRSAAAHPRPLRFLLGQLFWRTGCGRWITFRVRGFRLWLFPTNMSWQLWLDPGWRNDTLDLIRRLLRPGETMVDVGANIGVMSLEAALAVGPEGLVHAVEPHPKTAGYLQANLKLNEANQVQCHTFAVGVKPGFSSLTDDRRDDMNYLNGSNQNDPHELPVRVTTLDQLLPTLPHCHLLKIDVEGRELECVLGARRTLECCDVLLIEAGDPNSTRFGTTAADLHQKLVQDGFQIFAWEQCRLESVRLEKYRDCVGDWIATRNPEKLRQRLGE